ncbi:major intrinsic protein superfamily membrane channel protein [Hygrophoropsis aurantiaca]|uniref:Major intrinsic protein superfamily membrane channel protein n=1 Tax=Hygrophoropsis aurantiaca TaxID=72124 RepID=A0ACB8ALF7_9AGAM|nr:major intrinsic protein superfamily membrane channel protein [Hygrophoropsis aurantiaca]
MTKTDCDDCEHFTRYPNRWSKIREVLREPAAEFMGVLILVVFGTGADCQVFLSSNTEVAALPRGDFLSLNFGWAVGVALGVWVSGGISGGHINPAVTLALATFRDFPWKKVPIYILAQCLGGFCGAAIVYANYFHAIDVFEGPGVRTIAGSGDLLATYAADYLSPVSCFFSEFIGSAMLLLGVLSITDKQNGPPPAGLVPLALFIIVLGLGTSLGMETSYALNPARDLGPRIFTAMVGYGRDVFNYRNQYWLWCPILAPILGMQAAALIYDAFFFTGSESILNQPDARAARKHLHACPQQRNKIPAGVDHA